MADQQPAEGTPKVTHGGRRARGFSGPLILIGVGIIFLLNNLGLLPWNVWNAMWRAWPVILILAGLDLLIGRRSAQGAIVALALGVAVLIGVVAVCAHHAPAGATRVEAIHQPLEGATAANVRLEPGVAILRVGASSDARILAEGTIRHGEMAHLAQEFRTSGGTAYLTVKCEPQPEQLFFGDWSPENRWEVKLGPGIPIALTVEAGVGSTTLDLSGLAITHLGLNSGVGKTRITLPGRGHVEAKVEAGIGEVAIVVPKNMSARVRLETGIGHVHVPASYRREGEEIYVSPSAGTNDVANLSVHGGIGTVRIEEEP